MEATQEDFRRNALGQSWNLRKLLQVNKDMSSTGIYYIKEAHHATVEYSVPSEHRTISEPYLLCSSYQLYQPFLVYYFTTTR
jgi:hypothetical protein